jgi:hypothetical protein
MQVLQKKHVKINKHIHGKKGMDIKDCYDWAPDTPKARDRIWKTVKHMLKELIQEEATFSFSLVQLNFLKGFEMPLYVLRLQVK